MSKLIALVGDTGSGKSHSIQYLDPTETYIINVAGKELPFKEGEKNYNRENKNIKNEYINNEIQRLLYTISEKAPHIKNIVIEDGSYIMGFETVARATEVGYTKFSVLAQETLKLVQEAKKLRDDIIVIYISHLEESEDSGEIVRYKMKTAGKMIDRRINLEGLFTIVIYSIAEYSNEGTNYAFLTNKYKKYPAKSPTGMFENIKIPNNLQFVVDSIRKYYS
jgi:ABC-type glutathione transport system ATPase component